MQRVVLIFMLALVSGNAAAKWIMVNDNGEFTTYGDRATIRKTGHVAYMRSMYDFKHTQALLSDSAKYNSTRQLGAYDCVDERTKLLGSTLYSRRMGKGRVVHRYKLRLEWQTFKAKSAGEALWKMACRKNVTHQD
jgi:hypothetical protein